MKRLIPLVILTLACANGYTQNGLDALIFSETFAGGTARNVSMAGAFGALGADFSATTQNPAGLGFYRKSEFTVSPVFTTSTVKSTYLGNQAKESKFNFNNNNLGFVFSFNDRKKESGFIGWSLGMGFNKINSYNSNSFARGVNDYSSLADEYASTANFYSTLDPYTDGLFYDAYILDYDTIVQEYYVNPDMKLPGIQLRSVDRSGKMNEWVFGTGFNISNIVYFGFSFNFIPVDYRESSTITEYDANEPDYLYFSYYDSKKISGSGYGAKFGVIVRPIPMLRIGAAYHTRIVYWLTQSDETFVDSYYASGHLETFFPADDSYAAPYDYKVEAPGKFVGSLAITLGSIGVISTDIEYIDYASMRLRNTGDYYDFTDANQEIPVLFRGNINSKTGAEIRFEPFYVRTGFGYYGSPYKSNDLNGDAYTLMYCGGVGLRTKNFFIDMAVSNSTRNESYMISPSVDPAAIKYTTNTTRFITTMGLKF